MLFHKAGKREVRELYLCSKSCSERINKHVDKGYLISVMPLDLLKAVVKKKKKKLSRALISLLKNLRCQRMGQSSYGLIIDENQTRYNEDPK